MLQWTGASCMSQCRISSASSRVWTYYTSWSSWTVIVYIQISCKIQTYTVTHWFQQQKKKTLGLNPLSGSLCSSSEQCRRFNTLPDAWSCLATGFQSRKWKHRIVSRDQNVFVLPTLCFPAVQWTQHGGNKSRTHVWNWMCELNNTETA